MTDTIKLTAREYMRWPVIRNLYEKLTEDSSEHAVDILWTNTLFLYFRVEDNYGIQALAIQNRTSETTHWTARCLLNALTEKAILIIEGDRLSNEDTDDLWTEATRHLVSCPSAVPALCKPTYGIATVGHYSRYYTLSADAKSVTNFSSRNMDYMGQPLHFKHDENSIHTLLEELRQLTSE